MLKHKIKKNKNKKNAENLAISKMAIELEKLGLE